MTASNLAICVGPSLLWTNDQSYMLDQNYSKEVSALVQILIDEYPQLFGDDLPKLFEKKEMNGDLVESVSVPVERTLSSSSSTGKNSDSGGQMREKQTKSKYFRPPQQTHHATPK